MQFGALAQLTNLQHLGLNSYVCEPCELLNGQMVDSNLPVLTDALPFLQRLTSLHLGELWAQDTVVTSAQQPPCLQELLLANSRTTAASYSYLPETLTRLQLRMDDKVNSIHHDPAVHQPPLNLYSTPAFFYLTALQHSTVSLTGLVHPAVFVELSALQHLDIRSSKLAAAPGEPGLSVFSRLTKLQAPGPA